MMHMEHRLAQTQSQRLMLTQRMQQAIQILQLNSMELEQYVQQELENNPVLEAVQVEPETNAYDTPQEQEHGTTDDSMQFEDGSFDLDDYAGRLPDYRREGVDLSRNTDLEARREFYQDSITKEESFAARLYSQLKLAANDDEQLRIGERILGEIDDRGYFTGDIEAIASDLKVPVEKVQEVLALVQTFEPTGIGARDVIECLRIQIDTEYPNEPQLRELVENHLEELEHRQIPKIAKAMNVSVDRVEELKELLATLNPWPGHGEVTEPPQYVIPDVIVDKLDDEDEYVVYLSEESSPQLRVSNDYKHIMKTGNIPKEDKKYLREKFDSAKWLIRNIEQRKQTILRIATAIVEVQREFFEKGIEYIKPLTLQEIATRVGVHEATVSRTTRGKYMQTPQGLFEMKYFFSPGLKRNTGGEQSSKSVQSIIKKIFDEEDKAKPLSDQKVADILKERGIHIARRTVTKYREALGIPPTNLRRTYHGA